MSEFFTHVVKLGPMTKHPNADTLDITEVYGGYPCIVKRGSFKEGDLAIYCSVDALVPTNNPKFSFLKKKDDDFSSIRAQKLRGIFSMGLLVTIDDGMTEGQNVQELLGIKKYELPQSFHPAGGGSQDLNTSGRNVKDPGCVPIYDLEGIRKYQRLFTNGEDVYVVEKCNGMNLKAGYINDEFYVASRTKFKARSDENDFWIAAKKLDLENKLSEFKDLVFWGELTGGVRGMRYGQTKGVPTVYFFDIFNTKTQQFLDFDKVIEIVEGLDLKMAPIIYRGPYIKELIWPMAEGNTTVPNVDPTHIREGCVIRTPKEEVVEISLQRKQRKVLKLVGQGYLLRG